MSKVTVDTSGFDDLLSKLQGAKGEAADAMIEGALADSQLLVPTDTGELKRSKKKEVRSDGSVAALYTADHAAVIHNKPGLNLRNGQWQFLRQPLMNAKRRLADAAAVFEGIFK